MKPPQFHSNRDHQTAVPKRKLNIFSTKIKTKILGKSNASIHFFAGATVRNDCEEVFDFVIVGSGPAGSVIANRLSENPNWNVLLLEVGDIPTNETDIVALAGSFQATDYNWAYVMEPQDNAALGKKLSIHS